MVVSLRAAGQATPVAITTGDLVSSGPNTGPNNSWTLHTPDISGNKILYLRPAIGGAWSSAGETRLHDNGDVRISNRLSIGADLATMGTMMLAVEGKIGARGVHVVTSGQPWPDYVFAPTYCLRPLADVARFVRLNRHLPDVPAAAEVAANGLDLEEMDARLLRKIEELTLYLIEQQQENVALRARVERLENARK